VETLNPFPLLLSSTFEQNITMTKAKMPFFSSTSSTFSSIFDQWQHFDY